MKTTITLTRAHIQAKDYEPFLHYHPEAHANAPRARHTMGTLTFLITGYAERFTETIAEPEVREYLRGLYEAWPEFLYHADLSNEAAKCFVFALLDEVHIRTHDDQEDVIVCVGLEPLVRWLHGALTHLLRLGHEKGVEPLFLLERVQQVLDYFDCPPQAMLSVLDPQA